MALQLIPVAILAFFLFLLVIAPFMTNAGMPVGGEAAFSGMAIMGFVFLVIAVILSIVIAFIILGFIFRGKGGAALPTKRLKRMFEGKRGSIYE